MPMGCFPSQPVRPRGLQYVNPAPRPMTLQELQSGAVEVMRLAATYAPSARLLGGSALALMGSGRETGDIDILVDTPAEKEALKNAIAQMYRTNHNGPFYSGGGLVYFRTTAYDFTIDIHDKTEPAFAGMNREVQVVRVGNNIPIRIANPLDILAGKRAASNAGHTRSDAKKAHDAYDIKFLHSRGYRD